MFISPTKPLYKNTVKSEKFKIILDPHHTNGVTAKN
ncbi:not available [Yersinia enterocolitica]|nr:not available [Yersinia enterocolitica]